MPVTADTPSHRERSNPSTERTLSGKLRWPTVADHFNRLPPMSAAAKLSFRQAVETDLPHLYQCDPYSKVHESRRLELSRMVQQKSCRVALGDGQPLGFAVLQYSFFGNGFIPLICVATEHQGTGVGLALLVDTETQCLTPKLFSSTNASNGPAQRLFSRAGFIRSGIVENLDEGDPELIYFKVVSKTSQAAKRAVKGTSCALAQDAAS